MTQDTTTQTTRDDDFLAQVRDAEERAQDILAKAKEQKQKNLETLKGDLADAEVTAVADYKEAAKQDLDKTKVSARMSYEKQLEIGKTKAEEFLMSREGRLNASMAKAEQFLLAQL